MRRRLLKNTLYTTLSQVLTVPLSMLTNAMMARYLAPEAFGQIYLASTISALAFLFVNFGHEGALPAAVAQDVNGAGRLLGSSMLSRSGFVLIAYAVSALVCHLLGYEPIVQQMLLIMFAGSVFVSIFSACKETVRGFERADIPSAAQLILQVMVALSTVLVLVLGAGVIVTLWTQALVTALILPPLWWSLRQIGVHKLSYDSRTAANLLRAGVPFVLMSLIGYLAPAVDAIFLSDLSSEENMGAYSAARRLLGVLMLPANGVIGALYPTLCRLWTEDRDAFARTSGSAIRGVMLFAVPLAVGCGLFPEIGVSIFGRERFGAAESDLRVMSVFVLLVYVSMPLGTCVLAAGKQRAWSIVQSVCVVMSFACDPFLVPWFEQHMGNGGLGVCVATVLSEVVVVGVGFALAPKGVLDGRFARSLLHCFGAGAAMVALTFWLKPLLPVLVVAPLVGCAYFAILWLTGGIDPEYIEAARGFLGRKLARLRGA